MGFRKKAKEKKGARDANEVGLLPVDCRPKGRLVFHVNSHERPARVDLTPEGQIRVMFFGGGRAEVPWVSLAGIGFLTSSSSASWEPLPLLGLWENFGGVYDEAEYRRVKALAVNKDGGEPGTPAGFCVVKGLIQILPVGLVSVLKTAWAVFSSTSHRDPEQTTCALHYQHYPASRRGGRVPTVSPIRGQIVFSVARPP